MQRIGLAALVAAITVGLAGCSSSGGGDDGPTLEERVRATMVIVKNRDPNIQKFFDNAYGYAIFPAIGKGGLIVGGAYGEGLVYEQGALIGKASMSQGTIGLQIGGQRYREIIFFRDKAALDTFTSGSFEFSGNASAVAVSAGAAAGVDYEGGVAVFVTPIEGLMLEASIGGQKFGFEKDV